VTAKYAFSQGKRLQEVMAVAEEQHAKQATEKIHRARSPEGLVKGEPHPEREPEGDFAGGIEHEER
jgi:hypothetical protein